MSSFKNFVHFLSDEDRSALDFVKELKLEELCELFIELHNHAETVMPFIQYRRIIELRKKLAYWKAAWDSELELENDRGRGATSSGGLVTLVCLDSDLPTGDWPDTAPFFECIEVLAEEAAVDDLVDQIKDGDEDEDDE